jgi:hypothetical protein
VFYIYSFLLLISTTYGINVPLWCLIYLDGQITKRKALRTSRYTNLLHCYYAGWIVSHLLTCSSWFITVDFGRRYFPVHTYQIPTVTIIHCYNITVVIRSWSSGLTPCRHMSEPSLSLKCSHLPGLYAGLLSPEILYRCRHQWSLCMV